MRIFLNGLAAFGQDVFNALREAGEEVVAVSAAGMSLSGRPDRLRAAADAAGVPAFETPALGDPEVQARLRALRPELGVMAFVRDFTPLEVLALPEHGTIQYHPSLLPKHRGRSAINWAIIGGEKTTGISIFWPDAGMDTGPVLLQREVEIGPDDTVGSLYYDKMYKTGIDMLLESVKLVAQGKAPKLVQDESQMTYEKPCDDRTARIDWRKPASAVYDLIRGCDPSPGAWTRLEGQKLRVVDARLLADGAATPSIVASVGDEGVVIGAEGGAILARKLQGESGGARAAAEVASELGIVAGTRFLNPRLDAGA